MTNLPTDAIRLCLAGYRTINILSGIETKINDEATAELQALLDENKSMKTAICEYISHYDATRDTIGYDSGYADLDEARDSLRTIATTEQETT